MKNDALVRCISLVVDPAMMYLDAYVRTEEGGKWSGSGAYVRRAGSIEAALYSAVAPLRRVKTEAPGPLFFGTHSLINYGWLVCCAPTVMKLGASCRLAGLASCSVAANGGGAPDLHFTEAVLERSADRVIETSAGRFECAGWQVIYGYFPPIRMWLSKPDDMLVLMEWDFLDGRYELISLHPEHSREITVSLA